MHRDDRQPDAGRDRSALDAVRGPWTAGEPPAEAMPAGTRVRVVKDTAWDGPWRHVFTGRIDDTITPRPVQHGSARPGELEYSVAFEEPQLDSAGDGPYRKAVIWGRYLEPVAAAAPSTPAVRHAVRAALPADVDALWALAAAFATTFTPHESVFRATFAEVLSRDSALLLVAQDGGVVIGYLAASAHLTFLADGEVMWVEEVMVAEPHRRAGVGAALVARAEGWAGARGAAYVSLASRRAGAFYVALGYEDSATFYRKMVRHEAHGDVPAS